MVEQLSTNHKYQLLELLDDIKPSNLSKTSQTNYVKKLSQRIQPLILEDGSNLILVIQAIKDCDKPCYKRDVLIEILKLLLLSVSTLSLLLAKPFAPNPTLKPWKELANSLVAIPDVVANCGVLLNYPDFKREAYYSKLLTVLYAVLLDSSTRLPKDLSQAQSSFPEQQLFYCQLLGRIAITHCQLVWTKFSSLAMKEAAGDSSGARRLLTQIIECSSPTLSVPDNGLNSNLHFGMFSEHLIAPVFYNFTPHDQDSCDGKLIRSILGTSVLHNEVLEYILCNKYLLQTNYKHNMNRQLMILFNIFSYLSSLNQQEQFMSADSSSSSSSCPPEQLQTEQEKREPCENLLIKTLLAVGDSWSDSTKVLLRPYDQSRFITCAFIVGLRFALQNHKPSLAKCAHKLQANIIQGFPVYLNRASEKHRWLAMLLGEVVLAKLVQVMEEHQDLIAGASKSSQKLNGEQRIELNFDVQWDSELLFIKNLLDCDIISLFDKTEQVETVEQTNTLGGRGCEDYGAASLSVSEDSRDDDNLIACVISQLKKSSCNDDEDATKRTLKHNHSPGLVKVPSSSPTKCYPSKRAVIELDNEDDEDLVAFEMSDDDEGVDDNDEQDESAPIYLRDCIAGLAENKHPRYVRLCLIRVGLLLEHKNNELATACTQSAPRELRGSERVSLGTAISDVAVELAQLLLYLDDQYGISEFEALRVRALSGLCVASPDTAVKYLLDEFNGTTRSIRHQLDIMQALVISAERLATTTATNPPITTPSAATTTTGRTSTSTGSANGFVKYVSLYFYGLVHRLKADLSVTISPSTIVSAAAAAAGAQSNANSRQQTMIRRVIDSLTSSMSQIDRNLLFSSSRSSCGTSTRASGTTFTTTATAGDQTTKNTPTLSHTTTSLKRAANAPLVEQGKELEDHDNSYLLSRLLFSVSLLIKCVHQQPITCKLANDLLDILAAYRGHPDVGVRKAMVSCLTVVKDCTPSVYFREYLYDKTISLFGEWLSSETTQITKLLGD